METLITMNLLQRKLEEFFNSYSRSQKKKKKSQKLFQPLDHITRKSGAARKLLSLKKSKICTTSLPQQLYKYNLI